MQVLSDVVVNDLGIKKISFCLKSFIFNVIVCCFLCARVLCDFGHKPLLVGGVVSHSFHRDICWA